MKYAFMTFSCPQATWDDVLAMAKRYGYAGVEPRIGAKHGHGVEIDADAATRKQKRAAAQSAGVAVAAIACSAKFSNPATTEAAIKEALGSIDLAADMGCSRVRAFGGQLGPGLSRDDAVKHAAAALRTIAPHARQRGVYLCLETHDDWSDPRELAKLLAAVADDRIVANWDIMHPIWRGNATMDEAYNLLKPWIRHVHFHDGVRNGNNIDMVPIGEGIVDHGRAIELLQSAKYDGYLSGEWIKWEPAEVHLPREIERMRKLERV